MPRIKTDFVISGERSYKQAISEINGGLGVLDAEMKKVTATYRDNGSSMEALAAKGDVLERRLLTQREKVDAIREALKQAQDQYGESDRRTMELEKSLRLAETAMIDTEHAIQDNNKAMQEASQQTEQLSGKQMDLAGTVQDLAGQFGVKLPPAVNKALDSMSGFSAGSVAALGGVALAVAAVVKVYKELIDLTTQSAAKADEILTLSQVTGLDTSTIQEMQYASQLIDVSFETIRGSMTKLKNNMQDARNGNEKLAATFKALGVSVTDASGNLRDSEDVFYDVIDALGEIDNATERDTIAMDVFGKKAEELNPLIVQGSDRMRELAEEAHSMGAVMDGEALESLGAVDDALQRLHKTQDAVKDQIATQMAPATEEFYKTMAELTQTAGKALVDSGLIEGLGDILISVTGLIEPLMDIVTAILPELTNGMSGLAVVLQGVAGLFAAIADAINVVKNLNLRGLLSGDLGDALGFGYSQGRANNYQTWAMKQQGTYGEYQATYEDFIRSSASGAGQYGRNGGFATGTMHFAGGRALVGENGPELVELPEGSRIHSAQDTRLGGGNVIIEGDVVLDASKCQDLVDAAAFLQDLRTVRRMG